MSANRLYFAQHGLAVDKADDPQRPLSDTGILQTENIARQLKNSATPVSQIFHSGKLRASQTADIFASVVSITSVSANDHLSPNDRIEQITNSLTIDDALYIGHLPQLDKLVSYLISGDQDQGIIKFQNSAVICLEKTSHRYLLKWYLTQEISFRPI